MFSSSQRPVPLRMRPDLVLARIDYRGVASAVVKDPVGLKYYRLQPEQFSVLQLLDGRNSVEQVRERLQRDYPTIPVTRADVQTLIHDLHQKGLLISERPGQADGLLYSRRERKWQSLTRALLNPLAIRLPGWDPQGWLNRLEPWLGWMFRWWAVAPSLVLVSLAYLFLATRFDELYRRLPEFEQFFGWPNLVYLYLTLAAAKVLHEFGHGVACRHFGAECHSMGIMLLVFSPTLYCDATDSWMIRDKWKRIFIGGAGMYVEVLLAAASIVVWWNTRPGLLNHLALNVFFVSTVTTVIFNANPLMRFDGYFMLADWLEIPNLRAKADRVLQQMFAWCCLGIEPRHDPFLPTSGRVWFALFTIASFLYRWVIAWAILLFLYTVLKPYRLQAIGISMAVVSVAAMLYQSGRNLHQILVMPRVDPLSRRRMGATLAIAAALLAAALFVPFPWYLEAPFVLQPAGVHHVYNEAPGEIASIRVAPGDKVRSGAVVVSLRNLEMQAELLSLWAEREAQVHDIALYRGLGRRDEQLVAEERQQGLLQQEREMREKLARLEVTTPIGGVVVSAPRTIAPPLDRSREHLSSWYGTPLDAQNAGAWISERTHVCSIAPTERFEAVLLIDQADRGEIGAGREVSLKIDLLPAVEVSGAIQHVSDRPVESAPSALSNKYGGPLATVTDSAGREKLSSLMYQATAPVEGVDHALLRAGLRGSARVIVARRSLAEWIWRSLRTTFKFRL